MATLTPDLPSHSGTSTPHVLANAPGYTTPPFAGKTAQRLAVETSLRANGFVPAQLVSREVAWFYEHLGIDDTYFAAADPAQVADHVLALYGAKILAFTKHDPNALTVELENVRPDGTAATFIHTSEPGVTASSGPGSTCERRIDAMFLDNSTPANCYRLETYRSGGAVASGASQQLRCYFISKCSFPAHDANGDAAPKTLPDGRTDIRAVSDPAFLQKVTQNTLDIYQNVLWNVEQRFGPVIEVFDVEGSSEKRVVIGYRMGGTTGFFSALSHLYHFYALYASRKYVEQFAPGKPGAPGVTIVSLYLNPLPPARRPRGAPSIEHAIVQVTKEASLLFCLPENPFFGPDNTVDNATSGASDAAQAQKPNENAGPGHAVQEATYAYCGWIFAQHFCNRLGPAYHTLRQLLDEKDAAHAEVLGAIKRRFREETFTREAIAQAIAAHPELVRLLYVNFAMAHYPNTSSKELVPTISFQRLTVSAPLSDSELHDRLRRGASNKFALAVLEALLIFNRAVLKTNFYQPTKVALAFRLAPTFLPETEYPVNPFGMFFVVGAEFRGFHLRFRDVARGGIRIVRSRNKEYYSINQRQLFDENYGLASTQSLKNKDIPEGGAKGTILPSLGANPRTAFEKYVDSIIDLLIPGQTPGIKDSIVDLYGKPEILFFGPDEGTADMMDWAALHARERGAETWWKSFTTGKSVALGGIPHDTYGMTSLSVRQYVVGIYNKLGLREKNVTKVQTGGPDGDLGSNEILLSSDRTIAIIDGSGVLADPAGLDREELRRLARARVPVANFDTTKLGKEGYLVRVEDQDIRLPSGEIIVDGTDFRNSAHLRYKADLFVPCGGRPEAVNISNVASLIDSEGKPHFKYIVEGANLFLTQQARLYLEKRGVVLFKDASANKGGVTSSSLEVLAGLSLANDEYLTHMVCKDSSPTPFYASYVKDIQQKITENAANEFACIWRAHARGAFASRTQASDALSTTLNGLQAELEASDLFDDAPSRKGVLRRAVPKTLVDMVGLEALEKRLPEPYQRALFSSWVASHFIYKYGVNGSSVDFFHFARELAN